MDKCDNCNEKISANITRFSLGAFKKVLCMSCQKVEREKTMPPKLAEFLNKTMKDKYVL